MTIQGYNGLTVLADETGEAVEKGGFVIAAHNYTCHFGRLNRLKEGEEIFFTDTLGKVYFYKVCETKTSNPTAITVK